MIEYMNFRRRCGWCAVELRWWQLNHCRGCRRAIKLGAPPPCRMASRVYEFPDGKG